MKHIFLILFTLLSVSIFGQVVRLDSTVIHESRDIYNQAGYFIGSDSFHVKRVRLVRNCVDTNYERTDTLIDRRPMLFITMDSVTLGSGISQVDADDRYLNEGIIDTATVKKYFFKDSALDYTTTIDGQSIYMSQTTVSQYLNISALTGINISSTDRDVNFDNNDISIEDISDGSSVAIKPNEINLDRNATSPTITDIDVLTQGEIKALINDSLDLAVTNVTDGTTLDFTKTGRYLTGEVQLNSIDSTHLKPNSVKGSELEDVGTAGNYNNVTTDANGRVTSGSLLAYQTGTQVRDSIGILDADHDGDADDAELLQGANGSYYRNRANHTGVQDTSTITALDEFVEDRLGGKIAAGTNVTVSYNDGTGAMTVNAASTNLSVTGASSPYTVASSTGTDIFVKASTNMTITESNDTLIFASSGGSGSPGGSSGQVQYNSSSTFAGASNVLIESGNIKLDSTATPSAPTRGNILYTFESAGVERPYFIGSEGYPISGIQAAIRDRNILWLTGVNGIVNAMGTALPTTAYSTTMTAATTASTNSYTKQIKTEFLKTGAATTNISFLMINSANWRIGNATGEDGWMYKCTFGVATGTSNTQAIMYSGFTSSTSAPGDVNPSSLTNICGFGYDATDTNVQFLHNDGSGTATKVDLGASFPKPSVDRQESYEIEINCRPNGSAIWYKIRRIHTGTTTSGSVTTNLPVNTTYLAPRIYVSNNNISAVNGIALMRMYLESGQY